MCIAAYIYGCAKRVNTSVYCSHLVGFIEKNMKLFETFFIFLLFQNSFVFPFDSASVNSIAHAFIHQYYLVYDTNREGLAGFYVSLKPSFSFSWVTC